MFVNNLGYWSEIIICFVCLKIVLKGDHELQHTIGYENGILDNLQTEARTFYQERISFVYKVMYSGTLISWLLIIGLL